MSDWEDVPLLTHHEPNENEQRALGGFFAKADVDPSTYKFIQSEVPLGLQRVANAFGIEIDSDRSREDILNGCSRGQPKGFPTARTITRIHGFGRQAYTSSADLVMVRDTTIDIFELKTRNERIEGVNDIYKPFGQLFMYLDQFSEDFPSLTEEYALRGAVLAEDPELDIELLEPSFTKRNLGYFDSKRGEFLLPIRPVSV
jgi:hypothetical protein